MNLSLRDPANLDELLNYRLLRLYSQSGAPVLRLLEGRYGISRREWRLLALLAQHGDMSPSALAAHAHFDRPRATRGLQALAAKKLVHRRGEPNDGRRACVALSRTGLALYDELFPQIARINSRVVAALDNAAVQALDDALARLTAHAEQLNEALVREFKTNRYTGGARRRGWWAEGEG
jgi:DNA-binding MarR family transcriptional regulator